MPATDMELAFLTPVLGRGLSGDIPSILKKFHGLK